MLRVGRPRSAPPALPLGVVLALGVSAPSPAWDLFGHHVVAAIAWERMAPETRQAAVSLLQKAPADADLATLLPPRGRPDAVRERELFLKAAAWADLVRDETLARRNERYDRPSWHYVNHFWKETPGGPRILEERGTLGDLVTKLESLRESVSDPSRPASQRAIDLAWILHLVGDVHQPLHASGRVTKREPEGDRGGNEFLLDERSRNLHAFWDSILRRVRRQYHSESYFGWVDRVAEEIVDAHPSTSLREELAETRVKEWSREGVALAMHDAYPDELRRDVAPDRRYRDRVFTIARRRVALAGHRLARFLDEGLR